MLSITAAEAETNKMIDILQKENQLVLLSTTIDRMIFLQLKSNVVL